MPQSFLLAIGRPVVLAAALLSLATGAPAQSTPAGSQELTYHVDVRERGADRFQVRLSIDGLSVVSDVLQFAATAPGTYQVMNIGRFVRRFVRRRGQCWRHPWTPAHLPPAWCTR